MWKKKSAPSLIVQCPRHWRRLPVVPEAGYCSAMVEVVGNDKQTVVCIISGLLLVSPILMRRCCGRQQGRRHLSLTMRRSGNWASASWGSQKFCRRSWMICYCIPSVITFMSWPPPSPSFTTTATALRRTGRLVSAGQAVLCMSLCTAGSLPVWGRRLLP